jgi:hypothetical protein
MYTDRRAYRPTDIIDIFGCIRPRMGYDFLGGDNEITVRLDDVYKIPVTLDEYGCFTVEIPVTDYNGWGNIFLTVNGVEFEYTNCEFFDYDNSMYNFNITTDKQIYELGETVNMTAVITLFDGTPAVDKEFSVEFSLDLGGTINPIKAKTDSLGTIKASFKCAYFTDENGEIIEWDERSLSRFCRPLTGTIKIETAGIEEHQEYAYYNMTVLPRDIIIETKSSGNTMEITVSETDIEKYRKYAESNPNYRDEYSYHSTNYDPVRSNPYDGALRIEIHKQYFTKTTRYEYDAIEKVNIPYAITNWQREIISTGVYNTVNGKLTLTDLPIAALTEVYDDAVTYFVDIYMYDRQGRLTAESNLSYEMGNGFRWTPSTIRQFQFGRTDGGLTQTWYGYYVDYIKAAVNESIKLSPYDITEYGVKQKIMDTGKSLCIVTQNKFLAALTSDNSASATFTMLEEWLPNVKISGAYFDGRRIYAVQDRDLTYNPEERELNISAEFDKKIYKPGDEVTVKISVTDKSGKGRKSNINVNAVDEAAIKAGEWYYFTNFAQQFYYMKYFEVRRSVYTSYTQHEFDVPNDGAMGGGGGENGIRSDFRDNPAFKTLETDENGNIEVKFTLADSLTTWRITMHAVTQDDYVGKTKEFITTQLPLYVDIVMTNEFIEGDDICAYARCFGTEYNPLDKKEVEYSIEIIQDGKIISSDLAKSVEARQFNLGKLPEGDYTVKITAKCREYFDGMELPFRVVKSGVRLNLSAYEELNADNPVLDEYDITAGPVRLSLSNADMAVIYKILYDSTLSTTNRTDRYAANIFAQYYINALASEESAEQVEPPYIGEFKAYLNANNLRTESGGRPEITYGDGDVQDSARLAAW